MLAAAKLATAKPGIAKLAIAKCPKTTKLAKHCLGFNVRDQKLVSGKVRSVRRGGAQDQKLMSGDVRSVRRGGSQSGETHIQPFWEG